MVTTRTAFAVLATLTVLAGCTAETGMRRGPRGDDGPVSGLQIESPEADAWIGTTSVVVTGVATDVTEVTVNGVTAMVADGRFTATVPVGEGRQTLEAVAATEGRSDEVEINVDATDPRIELT